MTISEIRHLYDYTEWANALVLDAAEKMPLDQLMRDFQISHKSILGTLTHMAGAEWIWLERWHGESITGPNAWSDWMPERYRSIADLRAKWQSIIDKRRAYSDRLQDADLPREFSFKRMTGEAYSLPLGQQMQHVVNHATLHRGQVVGLIRQIGVTPPATDLLFYLFSKRA
jgi:uncharacterized damage-inducible protein DinB